MSKETLEETLIKTFQKDPAIQRLPAEEQARVIEEICQRVKRGRLVIRQAEEEQERKSQEYRKNCEKIRAYKQFLKPIKPSKRSKNVKNWNKKMHAVALSCLPHWVRYWLPAFSDLYFPLPLLWSEAATPRAGNNSFPLRESCFVVCRFERDL